MSTASIFNPCAISIRVRLRRKIGFWLLQAYAFILSHDDQELMDAWESLALQHAARINRVWF